MLAAFTAYTYVYKPHKTIEELNSSYKGSSEDFLEKASSNFNEWNSKVVELTGKITGLDSEGITLNNQIFCQFKTPTLITTLNLNQNITIKGHVIGYDDLLEELKLNQCILK
ncbi:hypothetical protein [Tenacibaculum sp. 190130A14a]